eukprot:bmy_03311T0
MAGVLQPQPLACRDLAHAESGELGMGLAGAWSLALVRAAPGPGAAMSGPPGSGASLPDPGQSPVGPAFPFPKPALIFQLERGEAPWSLAPQGALDGEGPRGISSGYPFLKPAGISHLEQVEEPLKPKLQGEGPGLICTESVSKSEKEGFILKEDTFEEAQDHMVLSGGPQCCGSQEFWFGKTCEEEKSRLRRWPAYPSRESVENTTCDITEVTVKDEMISVEEHLKDADPVLTHDKEHEVICKLRDSIPHIPLSCEIRAEFAL